MLKYLSIGALSYGYPALFILCVTAIRLQYSVKSLEAIYWEEGKLAGLSSEERLAQRQLVVKPLVDAFFAYLKQNETKVPKSGKTREAFTYALNQERYLRVFLDDGDVPIDNNASERAIRGFCIGKKKGNRIELSEEGKQALNQKISQLRKGQELTIKYFTDGYYEDLAGVLDAVDAINKELRIYTGFINDTGKELPTIIAFEDISEIGVNMT